MTHQLFGVLTKDSAKLTGSSHLKVKKGEYTLIYILT